MCCRYTFFFELKTNNLFYATIKTFGPSFSENFKLKFGVGGNTSIKAKKNQSMRVDDLTETFYSISMQNLSLFSLI